MNKHILPKFIITTVSILYILFFAASLFAQESVNKPTSKEDQSALQEQARQYRDLGLKYQQMGNLAEAKGWYQKTINLDPSYAIAYNDLGIIYDTEGSLDLAEESYLTAIKLDPTYASAYTNLAILYENKRDLEKAAFYWAKRSGLGSPTDPWTQKAASRLKDIRSVLNDRPFADQREEEVLGLMKDVTKTKSTVVNKDSKTLAREHFKKAKQSFNKGDLATAIKEALDAQYLDQDNKEIEAFIEKTEHLALTR